MEDKTYKVKYITGHTIFGNRPGQFVFYGDNKVKVTLDAYKDAPESVLFDVPLSEVEVIVNPPVVGEGATVAQQYKVNGKEYSFLPNDGSFGGDIGKINDVLKSQGANVPKGLTKSKTNTTLKILIYGGLIIGIAWAIYNTVKK